MPIMTADERLLLVQVKIERAKKHIRDLETEIAAFFATRPYEIGTKRNPQTGQLIYYVARVSPTPTSLATVAGDAIQNLRATLDHLAQQLYLVGTKGTFGTGQHIYFLIERDAAKYQSMLNAKVKGMRQDAIGALKAIEPYKGGKGHELWILHTLNNIDKHRLVVTVGSAFAGVDISSQFVAGFKKMGRDIPVPPLILRPADQLCPLKVGDELFIDNGPDAKPNEKMNFHFGVALNELGVAEGKPLLETVQHFADLVSGIVGSFRDNLS